MKHDVFTQQRQCSDVQDKVAPMSCSTIADSNCGAAVTGGSGGHSTGLAPPPPKLVHIQRVTLSRTERTMYVEFLVLSMIVGAQTIHCELGTHGLKNRPDYDCLG
jgi:hypothetical protein